MRPWDQNSAFWDEQMGDAGNEFHLQLIRPAAERLLGEVAGCRVLDVACGNGSVARRLTELGARVTGIDVSRGMLELARRRGTAQAASIDYRECDATDTEALLALGEGAFDAVVCNMALMDMSQITPLASALPRLLAAGGRFVFSITHPCFNRLGTRFVSEFEHTAGQAVSRQGIFISDYLTPATGEGVAIDGQPVNHLYFDRSLSRLLGPFLEAGLALDALEEPAFPAGAVEASPGWSSVPEIPPVLLARLRRQAAH
jgi:ubiquinone/menaquinone biosynthesis C-methylase UbiE